MADIAKVKLPSGTEYNFKDTAARESIAALESSIISSLAGGVSFIGETTTAIADGGTTNPITINNTSTQVLAGNLVVYGNKEFLWNGSNWVEMGDLSVLGSLAYKSTASGSFTPSGSISTPTFTGASANVTISASDSASGNYTPKGSVSTPSFVGATNTFTGTFTPSGSITVTTNQTTNKTATVSSATGTATYTPAGSVSSPNISVATAGATSAFYQISGVGTLPAFSATVSNEVLTLGWTDGSLPTRNSVTVKVGDAAYSASVPTFTGTGVRLVTGNIAVPSSYTATFSGSSGSVSVSGTPSGTIGAITFTGTTAQINGVTTASGTISTPTFTGSSGTITVS